MSIVVTGVTTNPNVAGTLTDSEELDVLGTNFPSGAPPFVVNTVSNPYSGFQVIQFSTTGSQQTFSIPTGACGVLIQPSPLTTGTLTVKTVSGDTGIRISPVAPSKLWFDPAGVPSNLYVTGSVVTNGNFLVFL